MSMLMVEAGHLLRIRKCFDSAIQHLRNLRRAASRRRSHIWGRGMLGHKIERHRAAQRCCRNERRCGLLLQRSHTQIDSPCIIVQKYLKDLDRALLAGPNELFRHCGYLFRRPVVREMQRGSLVPVRGQGFLAMVCIGRCAMRCRA